jgi:hypothetical protein
MGCNNDIETAVIKHGEVMDAADHIRIERLINIEGRNLILASFQDLRIKSLT